VLDYLSSANLGLYEVEKCAIDRQDGNSPNNEATQLKADCTLISYTFVFDDRQEDPMLPPII
jgi:hypothetical protein